MTTTQIDHAETGEDWEIAGSAWAHAATDWAYLFEPYARDAIEHLFTSMSIGPGVDFLDVACGSGFALGRAERLGANTAGIDASASLIDIATRRAPHAELIAGSMFALPWADASFDAVTSFNGIWGGCQSAIDEAFRVLRPGGTLGITFWGPGDRLDLRDYFMVLGASTPPVRDELIELASIGTPGVVESMLDAAGFDATQRCASNAVLELPDADTTWRALRSPGIALPSIQVLGEDELRSQVMDAVDAFRTDDGSYRLVNELTVVTARKPSPR